MNKREAINNAKGYSGLYDEIVYVREESKDNYIIIIDWDNKLSELAESLCYFGGEQIVA